MVNSRETPEEQIAREEAEYQSEAKGLSVEQLHEHLADLNESKYGNSSKSIADRAAAVLKTIEVVARPNFLRTQEGTHRQSLFRLLQVRTLLLELSRKVESKEWLSKSTQQQESERRAQAAEQRQELERLAAEPAPTFDVNNPYPPNHTYGPSAARGAVPSGRGGSSRARNMVNQATQPNPSSIANANATSIRARATNAARGVVNGLDTPMDRSTLNVCPSDREYMNTLGVVLPGGRNNGMGVCTGCHRHIDIDELEPKDVRYQHVYCPFH
jgi:hypothetical protein